MIRRHTILAGCAFAVLACASAPAAGAHQLLVAEPGPVELDLGTAVPARLVHATLAAADDVLEAQVKVATGTDPVAYLLVPLAPPEGDAPRADLPVPTLTVGGEVTRFEQIDETERWVDETTGVAYRAVGRLAIDGVAPARSAVAGSTIRVTRGREPTRAVLLVVTDDEEFAAEDVEATPRALLSLRAWAETPAPGATRPDAADPGDGSSAVQRAWIGAAIAVMGALLAVWWVTRGWRRARERGVERSGEPR